FRLVFFRLVFFRLLFLPTISLPNATACWTTSIDCLRGVSRLLGGLTPLTRFVISFATFFRVVSSPSLSGCSFIGSLPLGSVGCVMRRTTAHPSNKRTRGIVAAAQLDLRRPERAVPEATDRTVASAK